MKVLVACEFSGVVRRAFAAAGHDAWSCDLLQAEDDSDHHFIGDVRDVIARSHAGEWDLMIAHPPCTFLARSGARWWPGREQEQEHAIRFVRELADSPIPRIAIENPIGKLSTAWRKPDQIIQPWMFGHPETKATCLWLKGLPLLEPTVVVEGRKPTCHYAAPGKDRWKVRSRTLEGVAKAMAQQWGAERVREFIAGRRS